MTEGEQANGWQRGRRKRRDLCSLVRGWAIGGVKWNEDRKESPSKYQGNFPHWFIRQMSKSSKWSFITTLRKSEWASINVSRPFVSVTVGLIMYLQGFPSFSWRVSLKVRINPFSIGHWEVLKGHVAHGIAACEPTPKLTIYFIILGGACTCSWYPAHGD